MRYQIWQENKLIQKVVNIRYEVRNALFDQYW